MSIFIRAFVVAVVACATQSTSPGGWPQFLGPLGNGSTTELSVPATPTLVEQWRRPAGAARSAVVVTGARAYTLESDGESDILLALDAATGKDVWRAPIGTTHADAVTNGPSSTPAVAGNLVIALGSSCRLAAFNTADGALAWDVDLAQVYKTRFAARQGCSVSPLVHSGVVVLPTGAREANRLVALDLATGKQRWTADGVEMSLNTNTAIRSSNTGAQLLYHYFKAPGLSGLAAINLADGARLWTIDGEAGVSDTAAMPLANGRVLMQTWQGSWIVDASTATPRRLWTTAALSALQVPAVGVGGYIYGFGGNSGEFLACVDAATGETRWTERTYRGALATVGTTLVMQSEGSGLLRLIAADPTKYRELARLQTLKPGAPTVTPPTIAGGRIFVRNLEEIVVTSVR